jgi:hypothetical protein
MIFRALSATPRLLVDAPLARARHHRRLALPRHLSRGLAALLAGVMPLAASAGIVISSPGVLAHTVDLGQLGATPLLATHSGLRGAFAMQFDARVADGFGIAASINSPKRIDTVQDRLQSGIGQLSIGLFDSAGKLTQVERTQDGVGALNRELLSTPETVRLGVVGFGAGTEGGEFTLSAHADGSAQAPLPSSTPGSGPLSQTVALGTLGEGQTTVSVDQLFGAFALEFSFDIETEVQLASVLDSLLLTPEGSDLVLSRIGALALGLYDPEGELVGSVSSSSDGRLDRAEFNNTLDAGRGYRLAVIGMADGLDGGAFTLRADLLHGGDGPAELPEPAPLSLALAALALLAAGRQRRLRSQAAPPPQARS